MVLAPVAALHQRAVSLAALAPAVEQFHLLAFLVALERSEASSAAAAVVHRQAASSAELLAVVAAALRQQAASLVVAVVVLCQQAASLVALAPVAALHQLAASLAALAPVADQLHQAAYLAALVRAVQGKGKEGASSAVLAAVAQVRQATCSARLPRPPPDNRARSRRPSSPLEGLRVDVAADSAVVLEMYAEAASRWAPSRWRAVS